MARKDEDFNAEQLRKAGQVWSRQEKRVERARDAIKEHEAKVERAGLVIFGKSDMSHNLDEANRERMREYNQTVGRTVADVNYSLKKNVDRIHDKSAAEVASISEDQERHSDHEVDRTNRVLKRISSATKSKLERLTQTANNAIKKAKTSDEVKRIKKYLDSESTKITRAAQHDVAREEKRLNGRLETIAHRTKKEAKAASNKAAKEAKEAKRVADEKIKKAKDTAKKVKKK